MAIKMPDKRNLNKELTKLFAGKGAHHMLTWMNRAQRQAADTDVANLKRHSGTIRKQLDRSGFLNHLMGKARGWLDVDEEVDETIDVSLSDEEIRDLNMGARTAFADRGMAMSNPAMAQELLNRYQYRQQREDREIARVEREIARVERDRQFGANFGLQVGALEQNQNQQILGYLSGSGGQAASMAGSLMGYSADVSNTNLNMQASMYNSQQNNAAALEGQKSASKSATNAALIGAGGAVVGGALILF